METRSSAQDVHRCDLCETAVVHSYCDFCHVNLCKPCIGEHITDGYDKHKIVPFQQRKSTLIFPKCGTHPHKNCEFECKNCENILVCSSCISSEQHEGHRFTEVLEIYKTKKETIEKEKKELENKIAPTYEEITLDLENQLANLDGGYEKITKEISKQGEEWHKEIDIVINKIKTEINGIKTEHKGILQKHLNEIRQILYFIKQTLQTLKDIMESTELSSIIKYSSKIRDFSNLPPKVQVSLPTFIPKPIEHEKLYSLFGLINPLSTDSKENVLSQNQPNASVRELLDEPELVAKIQTGHKSLRNVTCPKDDTIWVSSETANINCFTINGSIRQTIKTKSEIVPYDIAVDSDGNILYCSGETKSVYKVQTKVLIRLQAWRPSQLCVTSTGDLLVTMDSNNRTQCKVVRYSGSTEKQTIQFDDEGKPLYSGNDNTKYITENRNHDICVADNGAGAVVVVNQNGKLRWRYTGHPSIIKDYRFHPLGITTDSQSRILTADGYIDRIHILDKNGQFLRYIDICDLNNPWGLSVDSDDDLFVCEYSKGDVLKIKYLK